jgi:hypothetical protein
VTLDMVIVREDMVVMVMRFDRVMAVILDRVIVMRFDNTVVKVGLDIATPRYNARHKQGWM